MRIFNNFWSKLFALMLSMLFWFFLVTFENVVYDFPEPLNIELVNKKAGLSIPYDLPTVSLRLAAPKDETAFLRDSDFKVYVDLAGHSEGEFIADVKVYSSHEKVNVISYSPTKVKITLEKEISKVFRIVGAVKGFPEESYEAFPPIHSPGEVLVTGPISLVDQVREVKYTVDLLSTEVETIRGLYRVIPYSAQFTALDQMLTVTPAEVEVQVSIAKIEEEDVEGELVNPQDVDKLNTTEILDEISSEL